MTEAFLALGSNVGDKLFYLSKAVKILQQQKDVTVEQVSSVYETLPFGVEEQENFFNQVVLVNTTLTAEELLRTVKNIEKEMGRKQTFRWGPREIDIDILMFGNLVLETDLLTIPHKYLTERDFFIAPLLELKPEAVHPATKKKLKDYLPLIDSKKIIHKFVL